MEDMEFIVSVLDSIFDNSTQLCMIVKEIIRDILMQTAQGASGSLADRVAMVTGAASGIGRMTALRLAGEGAMVVAMDRQAQNLQEIGGERIRPFCCDVTDHAALEQCVSQTVAELGGIDILVNNAGLSFYERHIDSTLAHWRRTFEVNLEAMYVLAKLVTPHMVRRKYGRMVNVSSTQAIAADATVGAYAASKGGIVAWTRALAADLAEYGVLVNAVAPGVIRTPMSVINGIDETDSESFRKWYVEQRKIPLARAGKPEEVANAILFLAGDQCTYITGQVLVVDGGLTVTF
jgi:3-oxoacyl-[acyl-carrier protein] reductase